MGATILILVVLTIFLLHHVVTCASLSSVETNADESFDIFVFALTWPGSACYSLSPCSVPKGISDFTIHGLWPNKLVGKLGPFYCNAPRFNYSLIQDMKTDLDKYWTDYKNAAPGLWQHEYEKHGSCAYQLPQFSSNAVQDYFKNSINLRKSMKDIVKSLQQYSITPSNTTFYSISSLKDAFKNSGFGRPALVCFNQTILSEVRFCTDKNLTFIDCPTQIGDSCSSKDPANQSNQIVFTQLSNVIVGPDLTLVGVLIGLICAFVVLSVVFFFIVLACKVLFGNKRKYTYHNF
ncbi:hypothetical protein C9374_005803 [Naegleria lovaniensis]|uniref:Uncharacterized protein n=1 Tax=Naegleria lovaniensis TaxID=51637 RepID=A0AA88KMZ7_NAELO|nr:uncharacterized protein C9374_005803 [Naegleria lovaniensis]KAG2382011.1 hypothetical protein C9374_005803 [Naegleria lovaniensis]